MQLRLFVTLLLALSIGCNQDINIDEQESAIVSLIIDEMAIPLPPPPPPPPLSSSDNPQSGIKKTLRFIAYSSQKPKNIHRH